ncbi:MAG: C40 family peptidase [Propionibacteriaceae bacterium]|jgi:cell wall-associated NlpC family hydrolase|nr:C40 family peptidase [Propionibacteriaceae bacterium]
MRRSCVVRVLFALLTAVTLMFASFSIPTATADPSELDAAKEKVKQLEVEASQIDEDYDEAKIKLEDGKRRVAQLRKDIAEQQAEVDRLSADARSIALIQFQGRGIDPSVRIFSDADPEALLGQISTANKVDQNLNSTLQEHQLQQAALSDMQRTLNAEVEALDADEKRIAALETEIKSKLGEAKELVDELSLQALADLDQADGGSADFDISSLSDDEVNAKVLGAIKYAVSKVKRGQYVWGASGPNGFDCSGLMLAAYRSVGIRLPHSSKAQSRVGRAVSRSELKPGDLIFWYHPVHHVGMYIGGGKIVHARNTRSDLVIQTLNSYPAPYAGARRIIG